MRWKYFLTALVMAAGCGLAATVSAHPPLPVGCSPATRAGCIYSPALTFASTAIFDTILTDPARNNYQLPVRVRYPVGAVGPLPVVIYIWKVVVYDKVLGLGTTDAITGEVATWAGVIVTTYFGGRTIEKVARIFKR